MKLRVDELLSESNVRFSVDPGLAQSLKSNGQKVPLNVYRKNGYWYIQDGHRRHGAAVAIGLEYLECAEVEPPVDHPSQIAEQFIVNQHREGLTALERAEAYRRLNEEYGWPQKKIADEFGLSEAEVSLAMAATRAHPDIRDALLEGKLSQSAAEPILSLPYEDQGKIAPAAIRARTVLRVSDTVKAYRMANNIGRSVRLPKVTEPVAQKRADPIELMALEALETARKNLQLAATAVLHSPDALEKWSEVMHQIEETLPKLREISTTHSQPVMEEEEINWADLAEL